MKSSTKAGTNKICIINFNFFFYKVTTLHVKGLKGKERREKKKFSFIEIKINRTATSNAGRIGFLI